MDGADDIYAAADKAEEEAGQLLDESREESYEAKEALKAHMAASFEKAAAARTLQRQAYTLRHEGRAIELANDRAARAERAQQQ